eukprot:TRINITY_DN2766_c0_g1_i1.p1 TRINITY_DN2766_c0_g1~~TRINITY_DN2766_c0_g1_i1.p1  ORF type:complete len:236 (-),score=53.88 TRINITY_DN2766_c0_g1_i1:428-1135(-)
MKRISTLNIKRSELQHELVAIKENIAEHTEKLRNGRNEVSNIEKRVHEMNETMNRMKKDVSKRSDELLSDRTIELQAVQFQLDKAREEMLKLNKLSLEKQSKLDLLQHDVADKENAILAQQAKLIEIEREIERNNSEFGEIDAKIQLKNEELSRIKAMLNDFMKRRQDLAQQNREDVKFEIADIEQELERKTKLLSDCTLKYNNVVQEMKDKETNLMVMDETIKKRRQRSREIGE